MLLKAPPHDLETERAVIGAMIIALDAAYVCADDLKPEDFYGPANRTLFDALRDMVANPECQIDELTLVARLKDDELLERVGGKEYIGNCVMACPSAANVESYIERLKKLSTQRILLKNSMQLVQAAESNDSQRATKVIEELQVAVSAGACTIGTAEQLAEELEQAKKGARTAVAFPWPELHRLTRALLPGAVTLLCGSPGASKSLMLLQAVTYWVKKGLKPALLCLEDGATYHLRRALAQASGCAHVTNDDWCRANPEELDKLYAQHKPFLTELAKSLSELHRDTTPTVDAALEWVASRVRSGCRIVAIDPFTLLDTGNTPWVEEKRFMMRAKRLCEDYGASLILVTHPRKASGQQGKNPITMDDLAGSSAAQRFAHCILWLQTHQPKSVPCTKNGMTLPAEINRTMAILKARNSYGAMRSVGFRFENQDLCVYESGEVQK